MTTWEEKQAKLARGEPFVVAPTEVAKSTKAYKTDPEVILGCIIVSGTLDTAAVLRTEIEINAGIVVSDESRAEWDKFKRVWQEPSADEVAKVAGWALRIRKAVGGPSPGKGLRWKGQKPVRGGS
jgi:hypothetical protein